jgi:hypothetical protein
MKVREVQNDISLAVAAINNPFLRDATARYGIEVVLHRPGMRDIRSDAEVEKYFDPDPAKGHEIAIRFVEKPAPPAPSLPPMLDPAKQRDARAASVPPADALTTLVQTLARLEADAGVNFVGLKWFRDVKLLQAGLAHAEARNTLDQAIKVGVVIVQKLINPHSPYATSTLRLNREAPEVAVALKTAARRGFEPMDIPGLNLSEEIIQGRR